VKNLWGTEGHNGIHGSAILPEALRWLWRDYPKPIAASRKAGYRHEILQILDPASEWEEVSRGHTLTEGPAVDKDGNVFFADARQDKIFRIGASGKAELWKDKPGRVLGMMFGPDGRLYATNREKRQVVSWGMDGSESLVASDLDMNDLAVTAKGELYVTDPPGHRVWFIDAARNKRVVLDNIDFPNGVILSADQSLVMVADMRSKWVWSYQRAADGSLINGQAFFRMETADDSSNASIDGLTVDRDGYLYAATSVGVQVCDQPGRVVGIIAKPQPGPLTNVVFGGANLDTLYVTAGDKVFRRKVQRKGVNAWTVIKSPQPRL
jgi:sugar lactone lactonase YvrE